jgi:hypothetical protein
VSDARGELADGREPFGTRPRFLRLLQRLERLREVDRALSIAFGECLALRLPPRDSVELGNPVQADEHEDDVFEGDPNRR